MDTPTTIPFLPPSLSPDAHSSGRAMRQGEDQDDPGDLSSLNHSTPFYSTSPGSAIRSIGRSRAPFNPLVSRLWNTSHTNCIGHICSYRDELLTASYSTAFGLSTRTFDHHTDALVNAEMHQDSSSRQPSQISHRSQFRVQLRLSDNLEDSSPGSSHYQR
jgi:hypothetical protein